MAKPSHSAAETVATQISDWLDLSSTATKFARTHPQQARLAMVVALETAAAQFEATTRSDKAIPAALQPFVVHREPRFETVGVKEAADRLQVSRPTIYDWIERKILLAWQSTKRGWIIPAEQILGPSRVVGGMATVLAIIDDPELAWVFLTEPWPFDDEVMRPIEKLKLGEEEAVKGAAQGFGITVT